MRAASSSSSHSRRPILERRLRYHDVHLNRDNRVSWGVRNPEHPLNWSTKRKLAVCATIYWLEFFMTAISSSGTAAASSALKEYGISRTLAYFAFVTLYLLGQTIGGIFCSPISEVFGRRTIYTIGTSLFCVSSVVVAAPLNVIAVYFGRFAQGVAAAIPATVAFGNFNDMYDAHTRIWIVYGYTLVGMTGLVLGPIFSVYVSSTIGWRWVFYISAIATGASVIPCLLMKESNAEQILQAKVKTIRKETRYTWLQAKTEDHEKFSVSSFVQNSLYRPLKMLVTEPLVFFCAALCGIAFGLVYGLTESLTIVYTTQPFPFSEETASLSFLAVLIGIILDVLPRFYDDYLLNKHRRLGRRILPETKITSFAIACPSLAIGLWIFGWTIPQRVPDVPWAVSMIGLIFVGFSLNDFSHVLFGYVADCYGQYAASAASAISTTRCLMAAVFPLFTSQMYEGLGNNVATTILAAAATAFCFTPWLFLRYGSRLRYRSKLALNDEDCLTDENKHMEDATSQSQSRSSEKQ